MRVQVVANKVDADNWEPFAADASNLGFGEPWLVSAKTNFHRRHFVEKLYGSLPLPESLPVRVAPEQLLPEMKLALVGRRNAGKSSFLNALAGQPRCIVSEIAGTTRDAIDVRFGFGGRSLLAIDTAGVRKRTKMDSRVEVWAFERAKSAVKRADVCLLLLDATQKISGVDKRLGKLLSDECKPVVVVVTKWDLVEGRKNTKGLPVTVADYQTYIEDQLKALPVAPIVFTSSVERRGLKETVDVAFDLFRQASLRVTTGKLNDVVRGILQKRGPSSKLGTKAKVLYVSQVKTQPPTIVMVVNKPELFEGEYTRYMLNRFHEELPFTEIPIRLIIRERNRVSLRDLASRGPRPGFVTDEQGNLEEAELEADPAELAEAVGGLDEADAGAGAGAEPYNPALSEEDFTDDDGEFDPSLLDDAEDEDDEG
ncbi:MAG: 50S ribosome-binding GTPase [Phycisphaerales bacterium]|nr:50S ribosome-binding GTPase [Phycisphaerales bacterium]